MGPWHTRPRYQEERGERGAIEFSDRFMNQESPWNGIPATDVIIIVIIVGLSSTLMQYGKPAAPGGASLVSMLML
jgi:hypothetical protein